MAKQLPRLEVNGRTHGYVEAVQTAAEARA